MKIKIVLVAQDSDVVEFFEKRKGKVVPKELRGKKCGVKCGVEFNTSRVDAGRSDDELVDALLDAHKEHDAVGVLVESGGEARLDNCAHAVFLKTFDSAEAKINMPNYFGHNLAQWLKNLLFVSRAFEDGKQRKCLLLPNQSFAAPELDEIFKLCRTQCDVPNFPELLEAGLKVIRRRSTSKKIKRSKRHFLKDDNDRFFELGKERHGQSETKTPPHLPKCLLTASARFGVTVDRYLHFNVSGETEKIGGVFRDCHDKSVIDPPRSHINVFPNGFIR